TATITCWRPFCGFKTTAPPGPKLPTFRNHSRQSRRLLVPQAATTFADLILFCDFGLDELANWYYKFRPHDEFVMTNSAILKVVGTSSSGHTTEQVMAQIFELIKQQQLKPGDRLPPERELAKRLGISRPSLRSGLRSL